MAGLLRFNEINAIAAAALAFAQGIGLDGIRRGLATFANTPEQNPGRYNFIEGLPFALMLDGAHNPDAARELCNLAAQINVRGQRRLVNLTIGNRHRAHFAAVAPSLARTFDVFTLGCDPRMVRECADYAGPDRVATMLAEGRSHLLAQGVRESAIAIEPDGRRAIQQALAAARPGDLLVLLGEPWEVLPILDNFRAATVPAT
jgi:UDP-N-acetylmuramyl tripeptide synthase